MKQFAIVLAALTMAASAFGQGAIFFNNRSIGNVVAPIYGPNPVDRGARQSGNATTNGGSANYTGYPLLLGTGYTAELWTESAPNANDFATLLGANGNANLSARVQFRTAVTLGGFVANGAASIIVPSVPGPASGQARFQVRAWNNGGDVNSTYAAALMANREVGISDIFTSPVLAAPTTPGQITGFTSFNLTQVPEPGVIALGVLGLGALLLRRRK
jgi:hypothetical protein